MKAANNNNEALKVLHLSTEKSWRGGEQQIAYLIHGLKHFNVLNFVACREGSSFEKYCATNNIPYKSFHFYNSLDIKTAKRIKDFCNQEKIDILHMHSGKGHGFGVLAYLFGAKVALVLTRRVVYPLKNNWFSQWKYNHKSIKRILCVSNKIREVVAGSIDEPQKCVTVYSGIDMTKFSPDNNKNFLRKQFNLSDNLKLVGNISALTTEKDHRTFINMAEEVLRKRNDVRFFIIGEGILEKDLKNYVSAKGIDNYVFFTGFLSNIHEVLPELDIFVLTSINEGLGTTVLDAFLSKTAVVATDTGGIPEMVIHNKTGLLSPVKASSDLAKNVLKLFDNPDLKNSLEINALEHLNKFTKENMVNATYDQYREVMKEIKAPFSLYQ